MPSIGLGTDFCKVREYLCDPVESTLFGARKPKEMGLGTTAGKEHLPVKDGSALEIKPFFRLRDVVPTLVYLPGLPISYPFAPPPFSPLFKKRK